MEGRGGERDGWKQRYREMEGKDGEGLGERESGTEMGMGGWRLRQITRERGERDGVRRRDEWAETEKEGEGQRERERERERDIKGERERERHKGRERERRLGSGFRFLISESL